MHQSEEEICMQRYSQLQDMISIDFESTFPCRDTPPESEDIDSHRFEVIAPVITVDINLDSRGGDTTTCGLLPNNVRNMYNETSHVLCCCVS